MNGRNLLQDPTMKDIIDYILVPNCPPNTNMIWNGGFGYGVYNGPQNPSWGSNPCQLQKLQVIMNALQNLLSRDSREESLAILNRPVITFVDQEGETDITILEAAIFMRWPGLVSYLLQLGASPNITTSGQSLIQQLQIAYPIDLQEGLGPNNQAIVQMLGMDGGFVPPGYPGTYGYAVPPFLPPLVYPNRRCRDRDRCDSDDESEYFSDSD